jgi:hypothetical protein
MDCYLAEQTATLVFLMFEMSETLNLQEAALYTLPSPRPYRDAKR